MTALSQLRQDCKKLLSQDKIPQCLKMLDSSIKPNSSIFDDLVMVINRHSRLLSGISQNTIKQADIDLTFGQISKSILHILKELLDEDITEAGILREQIQEEILVLCLPEKIKDMKLFFGKKYFPNTLCHLISQPLPDKKFDVIIIQDNPIGSIEKAGFDIWAYLKGADSYFLYYGEGRLNIPSDYADKLYLSNSRFSLYARLKELLDYLKYFSK